MTPAELKYKVFNLYPYQKVETDKGIKYLMYGCSLTYIHNIVGDRTVRSNRCTLLVKHISAIEEKDAAAVCKIFDVEYSVNDFEAHFDFEGAKEWIKALFEEPSGFLLDGYTGTQMLFAIDYLRGEGYALPAFGNTVDQLIEKQIFKIIE